MRKLLGGIVAAILLMATLAAPMAVATPEWSLKVAPGSVTDWAGWVLPSMQVRIGGGIHADGVDLASAAYTVSDGANITKGAGSINNGVIEVQFPQRQESATWTLALDLDVPAHREARPYDPAGNLWHPSASAHREFTFIYTWGEVQEAIAPTRFTSSTRVGASAEATITRSAKAKEKATKRAHGKRFEATAQIKAKATRTRHTELWRTAQGSGWSQAEADQAARSAAMSAATASAQAHARALATKAAKKAAKAKAAKKAKQLAKKKAVKKARAWAKRR